MIEFIKIENFKSIKKMEMEFRPVNILIGSNGSGKSNFIAFFKLLSAIFNKQLQKFILEEKADNILYFGRKRSAQMRAKIIFAGNSDDHNGDYSNAYSFELAQTNQGGLYLTYEGKGFNVLRDDDTQGYFYENNLEESKFATDGTYPRNVFLQHYASQIKVFHFHDTSATSSLRRACDVNDNLSLKQDGRNLPAFLYLIKTNHPKLYLRIEKTVQSIAPYITRFILEPNRLVGKEHEIELRWVDNGDTESNFSSYQLSDGTLRFIALATLLMQPNPPDVIIIDEPELGLHPFAIGKLAGMIQLASAKAQIIIATQSPGLISHFSPEDVVVIDKNAAENQTVFRRLNSESLGKWLSDYTLGDLWERNVIDSAQPFIK